MLYVFAYDKSSQMLDTNRWEEVGRLEDFEDFHRCLSGRSGADSPPTRPAVSCHIRTVAVMLFLPREENFAASSQPQRPLAKLCFYSLVIFLRIYNRSESNFDSRVASMLRKGDRGANGSFIPTGQQSTTTAITTTRYRTRRLCFSVARADKRTTSPPTESGFAIYPGLEIRYTLT